MLQKLAPWLLLGLGLIMVLAADLELQHFKQRIIGITTLQGIDANARNQYYWGGVISGLGALMLLQGWLRLSPVWHSKGRGGPECSLLAVLLALNVVLYVLDGKTVFLAASGLIALAILLAYLARSMGIKPTTLIVCSSTGYQLALLLAFAMQWSDWSGFLGLFAVCAIALLGGSCRVLISPGLRPAVGSLLVLFMLWPALLVAYKELSALGQIEWFCLLLLTCSAWAYRGSRALSAAETGRGYSVFERYLLLALLVGNTVAMEYQVDVFNLADYDYYHLGEMLVPLQLLFDYGSLPYIDYQPPHGLFDLLPQLFYKLMQPEALQNSLAWGQGYMMGWLPRALSIWILFSFFSRLLAPRAAFLVLFLLPTYHFIHPYYTFLLAPLLCLSGSATTAARAWLASLSIALLVLWRPDFGAAAVAGYLGVLAVSWRFGDHGILSRMLLPFAAVALVSFAVFLALAITQERAPLPLLGQIVNYLLIQTTVASLPVMIKTLDITAVIQYAALPFAGVSLLALAWMPARSLSSDRVAPRDDHSGTIADSLLVWRQVSTFLALVCLVLLMRSFHRHSLYEGFFNAYLFMPVVLLMMLRFWGAHLTALACAIATLIALTYLILPVRTDIFSRVYYNFGVEREYPVAASGAADFSSRVLAPISEDSRLSRTPNPPAEKYLNTLLQGDETFYDLTNSPLLYALSGKEAPAFIFETNNQSSDRTQRYLLEELEARRVSGELPLVVFRRGSPMDAMDGVANEVRSYRMAEYVFEHYQPCLQFERYQLWSESRSFCSKAIALADHQLEIAPSPFIVENVEPQEIMQHLNLQQLPYIWANYDTAWREQPVHTLELSRGSSAVALSLDSRPDGAAYLLLSVENEIASTATLQLGTSSARFSLRPGVNEYLLRVSMLHSYWRGGIENVTLTTQDGVRILSAGLVAGD